MVLRALQWERCIFQACSSSWIPEQSSPWKQPKHGVDQESKVTNIIIRDVITLLINLRLFLSNCLFNLTEYKQTQRFTKLTLSPSLCIPPFHLRLSLQFERIQHTNKHGGSPKWHYHPLCQLRLFLSDCLFNLTEYKQTRRFTKVT